MNIREAIIKTINDQIPITIFWAKVKDVDDVAGTCTVEKLSNELEYENTLLGLGDNIIVPEKDSKVLCGIIQNNSATFIIYVEKIDKVNLKSNEMTFKSKINLGDENGEKSVLGETLNKLIGELITHLQTLNATLITYGTAQAAEFPAIAASNSSLVASMTSQTATIASWTAKMQQHLSNLVKIK